MGSIAAIQSTQKCARFNFEVAAGSSALVISVIGIASSIFTAQIWAVVGFALTGISSIISIIAGSSNSRMLKNAVQQLQNIDQNLDKQVDKLTKDETPLLETATHLQVEVSELKEEETKWSADEKTLQGQLSTLKTENSKLEAELTAFKSECTTLQNEIKQLLQTALDLGGKVKAFTLETGEISETATKLQSAIGSIGSSLGHDLTLLASQIKIGQTACAEIVGSLAKERLALTKELQQTKDESAANRANCEKLQSNLAEFGQKIARLEENESLITKKLSDLETTLKKAESDHKEQLKSLESDLAKQAAGLKEQKTVNETSSKLVATKVDVALKKVREANETLSKMHHEKEALTQEIASLTKERDKLKQP